jgi:hypothetical protein
MYQVFGARAAEALKDLSEVESAQLKNILYQTPGATGTPKAKEAAKKLRGLLDSMYNYEKSRGRVDMGKRANYFPLILNDDQIRENLNYASGVFLSTPSFQEGWEMVQREYVKWLLKGVGKGKNTVDIQQAIAEVEAMPQKEFVEFYLMKSDTHSLPNWELEQLAKDKTHTAGFRFSNPRILSFLLESGNKDVHRQVVELLEPDVTQVMERYIKSAVRRSEQNVFMRNLGDMDVLWEKARAEGATEKQIEMTVDYLNAWQGMLGLKERDFLDRQVEKTAPDSIFRKLHSEKSGIMNKKLEAANAWTLSWNVWSSLGLSAFAAAVDPIGAAMRSSSNKAYFDSIGEMFNGMVSEYKGLEPSQRQKLINLIGVAESMFSREDLKNTYSAGVSTPMTHKINDVFFKINQTERITEFSRNLAAHSAMNSILEWKERAESDPNDHIAQRELLNVGVTPEDLVMRDGDIKVLNWDEWQDLLDSYGPLAEDGTLAPEQVAIDAEMDRDRRVRGAIFKMVDESSVRPTATSRQLLASNPYYSIQFQWKAFSTTFNNKIWRPAMERAIVDKNYRPIMIAFGPMVAVMLFADMVRDAIITAGREDDEEDKEWWARNRAKWKNDWTLSDHIVYAMQRAGTWSQHELTMDLISPLMKGEPDKAIAELGSVTGSNLLKLYKYGQAPYPLGNIVRPISADIRASERKAGAVQSPEKEVNFI